MALASVTLGQLSAELYALQSKVERLSAGKELEEEREQFEWCDFRCRCRCVGLCLFFLPLTLLPAPCCLCVLGAFCSVGI